MHPIRTSTLAALSLTIGIILGAGLFPSRLAFSYPDAESPARWEYTTTTVDANSIEAKVGDLSREAWEVISVTTSSQVIEDKGDGKPRIVVEKYQVTSRKANAPTNKK